MPTLTGGLAGVLALVFLNLAIHFATTRRTASRPGEAPRPRRVVSIQEESW